MVEVVETSATASRMTGVRGASLPDRSGKPGERLPLGRKRWRSQLSQGCGHQRLSMAFRGYASVTRIFLRCCPQPRRSVVHVRKGLPPVEVPPVPARHLGQVSGTWRAFGGLGKISDACLDRSTYSSLASGSGKEPSGFGSICSMSSQPLASSHPYRNAFNSPAEANS